MHNLFFLRNTKYILNLSFLNHSTITSCSMEYKLIFKETVLYMICSYVSVYDTIVSKYNIGGLASYLLNMCVTTSVCKSFKLHVSQQMSYLYTYISLFKIIFIICPTLNCIGGECAAITNHGSFRQ